MARRRCTPSSSPRKRPRSDAHDDDNEDLPPPAAAATSKDSQRPQEAPPAAAAAPQKKKAGLKDPPPPAAKPKKAAPRRVRPPGKGFPAAAAAAAAAATAARPRAKKNSRKRQALFAALDEEVQVADYSRVAGGHKRKVVPRAQSAGRTQRRRNLEAKDQRELAQAAEEFLRDDDDDNDDQDDNNDDNNNNDDAGALEEDGDWEDESEEGEDPDEDLDDVEEEQVPFEEEEEEDDEAAAAPPPRKRASKHAAKPPVVSATTKPVRTGKQRRVNGRRRRKGQRVSRLRNFRSFRLAKWEGEAMSLHISGRHSLAIDKLKELAREVPSAPQVYSSLAMVYAAMLQESQPSPGGAVTLESLQEQIALAQKAYGAYHVAAILFKRDYTRWDRAADLSTSLAALHDQILALPGVLPGTLLEQSKQERKRWLAEAKHDYLAADHLNPPGIDVGGKLAVVFMELGNLSEALTLLTDLKGRNTPGQGGRSDFDASYKAWLLYADLMLRIGYECQQWNGGDLSNQDYMMRRWLRKFSSSFDWKERRMQALAKALEAGAGTSSCQPLLAWLRARVAALAVKMPSEEGESKTGEGDAVDQEDRELLHQRNLTDLADFDQTTAIMQLAKGSKAAKERRKERTALVSRQHADKAGPGENDNGKETAPLESSFGTEESDHLPLSASVGTVCRVSADLMIHMIRNGLFDGGGLVGEAVSVYLKERASLAQSQRDWLQSRAEIPPVVPLDGATYDDLDADSDGENSFVRLLSDDEDWQEMEDDRVAESMKRGTLPPLVRSLYGLALLGRGGRKYVAIKCLESIKQLPQDGATWFQRTNLQEQRLVDSKESGWLSFHETYSNFSGRTPVLALTAEVVLHYPMEDDTFVRLISVFEDHDKFLASSTEVPTYQVVHSTSPIYVHRISCVCEVSAALTRCLSKRAILSVASNETSDDTVAQNLAQSLHRTTQLSLALWKMEENETLPKHLVLSLKASAEAIRTLNILDADSTGSTKEDILRWLSRMCSIPYAEFLNFSDGSGLLEGSTTSTDPNWLSPPRSKIAMLSHNLVVATSVEAFSGWNEREFSESQIRRSEIPTYVGIRTGDGLVAGLVDKSVKLELIRQWSSIQRILPDSTVASTISEMFLSLEDEQWLKDELERLRPPEDCTEIASEGEREGLWMCLFFSQMSLVLAESSGDPRILAGHVLNAMSVLFPLSQFCLNKKVWATGIGVVTEGGITGTTIVQPPTDVMAPSHRPGYIRPAKKHAADARARARCFWLEGESSDYPISNLVKVSSSKWNTIWKHEGPAEALSADGIATTSKIHSKVGLLRQCHSEQAVERASLEIAAALLEAASHPACENVLLAVQQAAAFASTGAKGGKSDTYFKGHLPQDVDCTPQIALVLLGRADCLQSIGFYPESAFLCSFVAKQCRLRRHSKLPHLAWNNRWRLVATHAYNVSVLARASQSGIIQTFGDGFKWEPATIDELGNGRNDCMEIFGASASTSTIAAQIENGYGPVSPAASPVHMAEQPEFDGKVDENSMEEFPASPRPLSPEASVVVAI
jgi:hypothetical protein